MRIWIFNQPWIVLMILISNIQCFVLIQMCHTPNTEQHSMSHENNNNNNTVLLCVVYQWRGPEAMRQDYFGGPSSACGVTYCRNSILFFIHRRPVRGFLWAQGPGPTATLTSTIIRHCSVLDRDARTHRIVVSSSIVRLIDIPIAIASPTQSKPVACRIA